MEQREELYRWVSAWREAGPKLESLRRREIQQADNLKILALLEPAFNHALRSRPLRTTSGLVELQKWLAKLRP